MTAPERQQENLVVQFFGLLLHLYPASFYQEFGEEMCQVFYDALEAAQLRGPLAWLAVLITELVDLPASLVREYGRTLFRREGLMETRADKKPLEKQPDPGWGRPASTWGEAFLAGLPYLLILLVTSIPRLPQFLGIAVDSPSLQGILDTVAVVLLIGTSVLVFGFAWRCKWPLWSASWLAVGVLAVLYPLMLVFSFLVDRYGLYDGNNFIIFLVLPLALAYLLYRFTRVDRLRGLLAAQLPLIAIWAMNLEFVPDQIELVIMVTSLLMMAVSAMLAARIGDWKMALWLFLATNFAVGFEFAYVGIYHGGALPFSANGPSIAEVTKNFIPLYLATSSIFLGPLLARMFREIGLRSGKPGKTSYRLALAGLLLMMTVNLLGVYFGTNHTSLPWPLTFSGVLNGFLLVSIVLYLVGVFFLYRAARQHGALPDWIGASLLAVLPLGLPLVLVMPIVLGSTRPINQVYGIPTLFNMPLLVSLSAGLAWVFLTAWLISRPERPRRMAPALLPQPGSPEI